jgi:hypothetical protein
VGHYIKQELRWEIYENLDALKEKVRTYLEEFSLLTIASLIPFSKISATISKGLFCKLVAKQKEEKCQEWSK